jgi:hypothetical protein
MLASLIRARESSSNLKSVTCIIRVHVAPVLFIVQHFELQEVLMERTPLLHPIHPADVTQKCHSGSLSTVLSQMSPVPYHIAITRILLEVIAKPS